MLLLLRTPNLLVGNLWLKDASTVAVLLKIEESLKEWKIQ